MTNSELSRQPVGTKDNHKQTMGNDMKKSINIDLLAGAVLFAMVMGFARGQTTTPSPTAKPPPPTQYQTEQEMRQLAADLDDPNFDEAKLPKLIQQAFADMETVSQSMDPDQGRQWRQSIQQQYRPVMQKNQDKMQRAELMARLLSLQQPLGATDAEFAAILPSLENVAEALMEAQGQGTNGRQASADLQAALDDPNSNPNLIKNKLDALRAVKTKANQDLPAARNKLRTVLTVRQEAVLVAKGILD